MEVAYKTPHGVFKTSYMLECKIPPGDIVAVDLEWDPSQKLRKVQLSNDAGTYVFDPPEDSGFWDELFSRELVFWYAENDLEVLRRRGVARDLSKVRIYDGPALCHLLQEERGTGLQEWMPEVGMRKLDYEKALAEGYDSKAFQDYAANDVIGTWKLFKKYWPEVVAESMADAYWLVEFPAMLSCVVLQENGVGVDLDYLRQLKGMLQSKRDKNMLRMIELADKNFNPNSNSQVAPILEKLGIEITQRTLTGKPKITKEHRPVWAQKYAGRSAGEFVALWDEWLKLGKVISLSLAAFTKSLRGDRIYPKWWRLGTVTGRFSNSNPNLQQIHDIAEVRAVVVPPPGCKIVKMDLSQIEYRILAHFSKDPVICEGFRQGKDFHQITAELFGVSRGSGKTYNFALAFGAWWGGIASGLGISEMEAEALWRMYWSKYKRLQEWQSEVKVFAKAHGYVKTIAGRRRHMPELMGVPLRGKGSGMFRRAINSPVQGSGGDIIKVIMGKLMFLPDSRMTLTMHDEVLLEVPEKKAQEYAEEVKRISESAWQLEVPLVADVEVLDRWN